MRTQNEGGCTGCLIAIAAIAVICYVLAHC